MGRELSKSVTARSLRKLARHQIVEGRHTVVDNRAECSHYT